MSKSTFHKRINALLRTIGDDPDKAVGCIVGFSMHVNGFVFSLPLIQHAIEVLKDHPQFEPEQRECILEFAEHFVKALRALEKA